MIRRRQTGLFYYEDIDFYLNSLKYHRLVISVKHGAAGRRVAAAITGFASAPLPRHHSSYHKCQEHQACGCGAWCLQVSADFLQRSLRGGEDDGRALGHRVFSHPSFSQSADKKGRALPSKQPQPTGYWLDVREQIKQNNENSRGTQAPSVIAVILGRFSFLCLFSPTTQLGSNPFVKGDCCERTQYSCTV